MSLPEDGYFREVWHGALVCREPAGAYHGLVSGRLGGYLGEHVRRRGLGEVFSSDTGYIVSLTPLTVLAPDISFVSQARLVDLPRRGFWRSLPDLAVEVRSPDQGAAELLAKGWAYLAAGTRLVWIVDAEAEVAWAMKPGQPVVQVAKEGYLEGNDVVPGFRCRLGDLFLP